jgi:hypothetical protein
MLERRRRRTDLGSGYKKSSSTGRTLCRGMHDRSSFGSESSVGFFPGPTGPGMKTAVVSIGK